MPVKLIVLMALMGINAAINLAQGSYVAGALGVLILVGVAAGNEAVRKLIIALSIFALVISVVAGGLLLVAGGLFAAPLVLIGVVFGMAAPAYAAWCLSQRDVQHWMYKRSMKGAAD